jgi:hypothetical protein
MIDLMHAEVMFVLYLSENIPCQRRLDLESSSFECLWLWLRPERLPRPLSGIAVCLIYNPPPDRSAQEFRDLDEYLIDSTDCLRNKYPDCGIVILGDFNNFDLHNRTSNHSLKQVVHLPTRGSAILDLIATNLHNLYEKPYILAPLSTSDHNIVHWLPLTKDAINTLDLLQVSLSLSYSIGPL